MSRLAKLNLIVGSLVFILAAVLGTVVTEFAVGRPSPRDRRAPRGKPGVHAPVRPGPPAFAGLQDPVELMLL